MRIEAIGLRTVWLGTLALWGLLIWALGLGGLGERIAPLSDDPSMLQRLPGLPAASAQRLGEASKYGEIAARPVFAEDRRPHPFFLSADSGQAAAPNVRLTGVLLTDRFKMATLTTEQGESLRLKEGGEAVQGWRLLSLAPRQATVSGSGGTQTLELKVFDGKGGQPPTVLGQAARAAAARGQTLPLSSTANPPSNGAVPRASAPSASNPTQAPVPAPAPSAPAPASPAPSSEQLQAIRERIEARRRQLQQQRQTNPSGQNP